MTDSKEQLADLKKQIQSLNNEIGRLGGDAYKNLDKIFEGFNGDIKNAKTFVKQLKGEVSSLKDVFGTLSTTLKNVLADLKGTVDPAKQINRSFDKLESITGKLSQHSKDEEVLSVKQLKVTQKQVQAEMESLRIRRDELKILKDQGKATAEQISTYDEVNSALIDKKSYLAQISEETEKTLQTEKNIQKTLGLTGQLFKGIQGTLAKIGIEGEHFEDMNKNLREAAKSGSGLKVIGAGFKEIFKGIGSALKDPLVQGAILVGAASKLYHLFSEFNKESVELARNFGLTTKEGAHLQHHFEEIASSSTSLTATVPNLTEAFTNLNGLTGTFANLSEETLTTYTDLTKAVGISAETAGIFYKLSLTTGKSFKGTTEEIQGQVKYQKEQLHTSLSEKTIMEGIAKTTSAQRLSLRGGTEALIQSVIQAKKLGLEMSQLDSISDSILNIESSIAAEQSAELMTGRELNVEAARYYANTNQTQKLAEVLSKDIGTASEFLSKSRIEAETLAAAYGMSRDALGEMLESKEMQAKLDSQMHQLGAENENELAKKFADRKLSLEEIRKIGGDELADKALNISFQEKLNNLMEKFKTAFVVELSPYFEKFADRFDNFIKGGGLTSFIDGVKTLAHGLGKAIDLLTSPVVLKILGGLVGLKALRSISNLALGTHGSSIFKPTYTSEVGPGGAGNNPLSKISSKLSQFAPGGFKEFTKSGAYTLGGEAFGKNNNLLSGAAKDAVFNASRTAGPASMGTKALRTFGKFGASSLGKFAGGPGGMIAGMLIDPLTGMISDKLKGPNGEATGASDTTDVVGGTASAALTGAAIGSMIFPVVGTAVGGIVGGAYGLISGLNDISDRKDAEAKGKRALSAALKNNSEASRAQATSSLVSKYQSFGETSGAGTEGVDKTNSLLESMLNVLSIPKPIEINGNQVGVAVGYDNYAMQ